jgi:hypothetical protein
MYTDFMRPAIIPEREADLIKAGFVFKTSNFLENS